MNQKTAVINGQTYKIGLHGKVFARRLDEWVLSISYTADEIMAKIKSKDRGDDRKKSDVSGR